MPDDEIQVTLSVKDIEKIVRDSKVKELVEECAINEPGRIGECAETLLLDRLVEIFSEESQDSESHEEKKSESMEDWIKNDPDPDSPDQCRPCALPIALAWYKEELKEQGRDDLAEELKNTGLSSDHLTTAKEMDNIKDAVDTKLKERLLEFDATTQANT